ncbi:MAG: prephenate dehydrogenase [Anaerolineae bacterium]|jgi:prephenate dehydrogenase
MDLKRVAIIGADCISVSIALGLKAQNDPPEIAGSDAELATANRARSMGGFDRVERKPGWACQDADLVIVAEPLSSLPEIFAAIAPHLQPGCLVTDTAYLKAPVMRWAEELLPDDVFFVGGHPVPNPIMVGPDPLADVEAASAELLREALYCFTPPIGTSGAVIGAFTGLAEMLEAQPFFIDVTEHDGLQAGVEGLPDLLAIALLRATVDTPGWQEMRKFASHRFATATAATSGAYERAIAVSLNREHILRRLNALLSELVHLRDLLTEDDPEALEEAFVETAEGWARWVEEREQGLWIREHTVSTNHIPSLGKRVTQMILGERVSTRLKERPDRPREE